MTDVDLRGAALMVHRSYSWFQKHWRTLVHDATGAPFPAPYIGAARGQKPWWRAAAIEAWKAGADPAEPVQTGADLPQRAPANDPVKRPMRDRAAALRAAAGG